MFFTLLLLLLASLIAIPLCLFRSKTVTPVAKCRLSAPLTVAGIPEKTIWGIDISHHQRIINWNRLTDKPYFIFLKSTEGGSHTDTRFKKYYAKAREKKILCGAYHFFSYRVSGEAQARHFIANTKLHKGDLAPVLDVERARRMPTKREIIKEVNNWMKIVGKHYGVEPILYTDENFYMKYLKGNLHKNYQLWLCDYYQQPEVKWKIWQRTDHFRLSGIHGTVDLNYFKGNFADLQRMTLKQDCCL